MKANLVPLNAEDVADSLLQLALHMNYFDWVADEELGGGEDHRILQVKLIKQDRLLVALSRPCIAVLLLKDLHNKLVITTHLLICTGIIFPVRIVKDATPGHKDDLVPFDKVVRKAMHWLVHHIRLLNDQLKLGKLGSFVFCELALPIRVFIVTNF